jgi:UDP-N-acetylglucosamine transferase subunit ALG13
MAQSDEKRFEEDLDHHQIQIETIEVQLNLKDASVASECEVNNLQAAQQVHRDSIHDLKKNYDEQEDHER